MANAMNNNFQPANAAAGGFAPGPVPVPVPVAAVAGFAGPAPLPPSPVVCVVEIVTTPKWINDIFMPNWRTIQHRADNPGGWLLGGPVVNRAGGTRTRPIQALQFAVHPYNLHQVMRTRVFEKAKVRAIFHPSLEAGAAPGATVLSPYREGVLAAMAGHLTRQGNLAQAAMFTTAQGFIDAERHARAAAAARPVEVEDEEEFLNNEGHAMAGPARAAPKAPKPRSKKAVALTVAPDEDEDEYAEASEGGNNNNENYVNGGGGASARVRVKKQPSAAAGGGGGGGGGGGAPPVMAAVPLPAPVPDVVASQEEAVLTESQEFAMNGLAASFGAGLNMNPAAGGFARVPEEPAVTDAAKTESQEFAEKFGDEDLTEEELAQLFGYAPFGGGGGGGVGGGGGGAYRRRTRRLRKAIRRAGRKSRKSRR